MLTWKRPVYQYDLELRKTVALMFFRTLEVETVKVSYFTLGEVS